MVEGGVVYHLRVGETVGVGVLLSDVLHHGRHVEQPRDAHLPRWAETENIHIIYTNRSKQ